MKTLRNYLQLLIIIAVERAYSYDNFKSIRPHLELSPDSCKDVCPRFQFILQNISFLQSAAREKPICKVIYFWLV